jgi:hypothetical protein
MDMPADPATPLKQVYQAFFDDLATEGTKPTTIDRYRYDIAWFEKWLGGQRSSGDPGVAGRHDPVGPVVALRTANAVSRVGSR